MAPSVKMISFAELRKHDKHHDVWIVVDGEVYDMTDFAPTHPGGADIIYSYGARDATKSYSEVHPPGLISETLPMSACIGRFDGNTAPQDWVKSEENSVPKGIPSDEKTPLLALINLNDFEESAEKSYSDKNWAFISGASNDNYTRDANKDFYKRIWFRPRIMRNVKSISMKGKMLGCDVTLPLIISPAGLGKTGGPEGEIALSAGAAATGIIQLISTNASFPLKDILAAAPQNYPFFFQLYVDKKREKTDVVLDEINASPQIKAIFVTVDLPVVSKREADERIRVETIETSQLSGSASSSDKKGGGLARSVGSFIDPSLSWDDIAWLRKRTRLPILLKGIQTADDAKTAMKLGCQGIMISNHGGRALDTAPPAILVLLELRLECPEVFENMEIYIDGGVRRGSDILKAICLGASGVGMGRPFMYALNYGREGVEHAVNILKDEVETAMQLCGLRTLQEADPSFVNTGELDSLLTAGMRHRNTFTETSTRKSSRL